MGEERMMKAMLLVLDDENPMSARNACKQIFGEKFPNVHRTLGNLYKSKFQESIGLAKKLSKKEKRSRRERIVEEGINLPQVGNKNWQAYLTSDEEELVCSFLQTCAYMHMPFNRDAFKVLNTFGARVRGIACLIIHISFDNCMHAGASLRNRNCERAAREPSRIGLLRAIFPQAAPRDHRAQVVKRGSPPRQAGHQGGPRCSIQQAAGLSYH